MSSDKLSLQGKQKCQSHQRLMLYFQSALIVNDHRMTM